MPYPEEMVRPMRAEAVDAGCLTELGDAQRTD